MPKAEPGVAPLMKGAGDRFSDKVSPLVVAGAIAREEKIRNDFVPKWGEILTAAAGPDGLGPTTLAGVIDAKHEALRQLRAQARNLRILFRELRVLRLQRAHRGEQHCGLVALVFARRLHRVRERGEGVVHLLAAVLLPLVLPRLALGASAGPGAFGGEEQAIGAFRFAARWLRGQGLDPSQLSAIAVTGDSMEPTLRDGDEILVDRSRRALSDGIHVVRTGDALLVKRLDTGRPGAIGLISDNPAYRAIELPAGEVEVIGRVVWKSGRL